MTSPGPGSAGRSARPEVLSLQPASLVVQRAYDSEDFKAGYKAAQDRVEEYPGNRTGEAADDYHEGYQKGAYELGMSEAAAAQAEKVKRLDTNFEAWLAEGNYAEAAVNLNEFSPDDIRARIRRHPEAVAKLHSAAVGDRRLGPDSNAAIYAVPEESKAAATTAPVGSTNNVPQQRPAGAPTSSAYQQGVDDAWKGVWPRRGLGWDVRPDYAAGYESVLRQLEQGNLTPPGDAAEVDGMERLKETAVEKLKDQPKEQATTGADWALHKGLEKAAGLELAEAPLLDMATELKGDTPMREEPTREKPQAPGAFLDPRYPEMARIYVRDMREELRKSMAEHIHTDAEDEQPDASVPDATVR